MNPFLFSISLTLFLYALFFHPVHAKATDSTQASTPRTIKTQCKFIKIDTGTIKVVSIVLNTTALALMSITNKLTTSKSTGTPMDCGGPNWIPIGIRQNDSNLDKIKSTNDKNWITDIVHTGKTFEPSKMHYYKVKQLKLANGYNTVDLLCAPYVIDSSTWREGACP